VWRLNRSGRRGSGNEQRGGCVQQSNCPTQAKGGLEWATRDVEIGGMGCDGGESLGIPCGMPLLQPSLWDILGITPPGGCDIGPCGSGIPGAMDWTASTTGDCALVGLGGGVLDFTGLSALFQVNQNGISLSPDLSEALRDRGLRTVESLAGSVGVHTAVRRGLGSIGLKIGGQTIAKLAGDLSGAIALYNAGSALYAGGKAYKGCIDATPGAWPSDN
jgi:hypothetical protein